MMIIEGDVLMVSNAHARNANSRDKIHEIREHSRVSFTGVVPF